MGPSPTSARGLDPAASSGRDLPLLLITLAAAGSSIAAFLLHAAGWVRMPYGAVLVTLPGMILLMAIGVWTKRTDRDVFLNRLGVGAAAGALGLAAYDGIRALVQWALPIGFNGFRAIELFGQFMTGLPASDPRSLAAGWAYHVSNGLTFAIAYAVVAGPARWWWGLAWGMVLETATVLVYPAVFRIGTIPGFVAVSMVGHAAYGAAVGLVSERRAARWPR
jgi:hypothetical protein